LRLTVGGEYLTAKLKDYCLAVEGLNKWQFMLEFHQRKRTTWRGSWREWVKKTFGGVSVIEIKDIGSGLKEDGRGLKKLIELAKRRQIDAVIIAYKDRLTRFGFEYLVELFKAYGANVIVAFQDDKDYMQELVEDFVEIVKSFAPRIYGQECEKVVKCVEDLEKDG
jgi:predicted site-specific integrase-resolvase